MKILSAERVASDMPDRIEIVFEDDGRHVAKRVGLSNAFLASQGKSRYPDEARYMVLKACREAERQFAFMRFGQDWRAHVACDFFSSVASEEEKDILAEAERLLCELI